MQGFNNLAELAGKVGAPQTVVAAIQHASQRTGIDFEFLLNKAKTESSFDPDAKAKTSSATGLYQFIEKTWLQMVRDHGAEYGLEKYACAIDGNCKVTDPALKNEILALRKDPTISAYMAAEFTRANKEHLDGAIKGNVGETELYLAHFMGAGGAAKFLQHMEKNPAASAAAVMPTEAAANHNVFYDKAGNPRSLQQVYDRFAKKFDGADDTIGFDAAAVMPKALPQSPALAAVAMASGNMDMPIHIQSSFYTAIPVGAHARTAQISTPDDLLAPALGLKETAPLRAQVMQQKLAFLTQMTLDAMHQFTPGMMLDEEKRS
jgi:hypothetical protein